MGFLGKAAAVKSLRMTVIQHRCKRRVRLPVGRVGEIWGRRQAEGVSSLQGPFLRFPVH